MTGTCSRVNSWGAVPCIQMGFLVWITYSDCPQLDSKYNFIHRMAFPCLNQTSDLSLVSHLSVHGSIFWWISWDWIDKGLNCSRNSATCTTRDKSGSDLALQTGHLSNHLCKCHNSVSKRQRKSSREMLLHKKKERVLCKHFVGWLILTLHLRTSCTTKKS